MDCSRGVRICGVDAPWRIVFVSTVQPAVEGFAAFARAMGHEPVAVVTSQGPPGRREVSPDRRAFFDRLVWESPPDLDIAIASGRSRVAPLLRAFEPDLVLCLGFPWRLTPEALAVPRLGCVNSHPSRLPRYRGPSPIAWHVRNGEPGSSASRSTAWTSEFDTGGVLAQGSLPLGDDDWMPDLIPRFRGAQRQAPARRLRACGARRPRRRTGRRRRVVRRLLRRRVRGARLDLAGRRDPPARPRLELHVRVGRRRARRYRGAGNAAAARHASNAASQRGARATSSAATDEAMLVRCGEDAVWVLDFVNA